ncbi:caffeoylshikimate esterase-like [Heracleum sosnowskyi]|uniref:Caffeoylshikimate esterase-like n=1 Tax=Heracleum sosnowskyi TaxID=360622 RepID=A0AAD8J4Z3_9APIA|nr:caffeoylshikimate esterase-like [Heracleum sosnowskyi]
MANEAENVRYDMTEEYILNSRGSKLFTCKWLPDCEPKAIVFLCHGYAMGCSISMRGAACRLVNAGFAVNGIDYEGHGKSSGLQGLITNFDDLVTDCTEHFTSICERKENANKLRFLLGESMGGAMVLLLHRKKPTFWDGAVLLAPMCKVADDIKPNQMVRSVIAQLARVIPSWRIVPTQDITDVAIRDVEVRKEIRSNPYCYTGRLRLQTGCQLMQTTRDIEKILPEISVPFLVVHGEADKVTDPAVSKLLYETASSPDKTIKLYPGMWHSLSYGELPENFDIVFSDIIAWLEKRVIVEQN